MNEALGNFQNLTRQEQGFLVEADNARVECTVYHPGIIRVLIRHRGQEDLPLPYAVCAEPEPCDWELQETVSHIQINTGLIRVEIGKIPLRFSFFNTRGRLLNADDPAFGTSWNGTQVSAYKTLQEGERFIGLGEKTGNLDRRGNAYVNWNTDYFGYPADADPLYLSTPFYIGLHHGFAYGIFFNNSYRSVFNFGASNNRFASFSAEDGLMDYFFLHAEDVAGILKLYSRLTGRMPLPPKWALGFQQCRYSYFPDSEVLNMARTFREKDIPADVIYLDIHYMNGYKVFTFHPERFPEPEQLTSRLREMGFHTAVIVDPGIKVEEGYPYYREGKEQGFFVKYPDGADYAAEVWPGLCHFPDFTNPSAREWWGRSFKFYTEKGIDGFWNDMNEPATWGQCVPDLIEFDFDGRRTTHREAHNVYGMNMARATYEGTRKILGRRPFVLTRAGFSGVQRYAAVWTGDNTASDEHMLAGVRLLLSMGLTGIPFAGNDVGGFAGEATPALFARWIAIGAFSPFFRAHSMINTRSAEPWAFGEEVEAISRNYIKLRYRLMPYLYSLFYEAAAEGLPVIRPLAWYQPWDEFAYDPAYQNQFWFGPFMMVAPVRSDQFMAKVFLPEGRWYDLFTDQVFEGGRAHTMDCPLEKLPVLVREGAIIPAVLPSGSIADSRPAELQLHIYHGSGESKLLFYDDDGESFAYREGEYYQRLIRLDDSGKQLVLEAAEGDWEPPYRNLRLYFHGFPSTREITLDGEKLTPEPEDFRWVEPVPDFDPVAKGPEDGLVIARLPSVVIPLNKSRLTIAW